MSSIPLSNTSPLGREPTPTKEAANSPSQIAHTLTACCRCRQRKTRCDTGLPKCTPCERTKSHCEYFDQSKGVKIPRHYVVYLQHKVRQLEVQLEALDQKDDEPDDEDLVRPGASVRIQEHEESKFLGPSSGIAITRLVMQLAKKFTESESISDIIDQNKQQEIKNSFAQEEGKPDSKVYPLISSIPAEGLPPREVTNQLVLLFNAKVMAMYPFFHEPTFWKDVEAVYNNSQDAFQNFAVRMVIAVSLQRMDTHFAGLADSFYLAALCYLEDAIKPMNVKTVQSFCLLGAYSLLTPTRTAVYYVIGLATRLIQALGLCDEKSIIRNTNGEPATFIEIDMKRRLFWSVITMEYGLAHSMGRPSCFPIPSEHINVKWYELVDDQYITNNGIAPDAPTSLKKWISRHFFRMRLLQLEIRRKLYQKKRKTPENENDPWFAQMEEKLNQWKNETPNTDAGSGLDPAWFTGRYNTMIVFMFRPSPQCPKPSINAALRCFPACQYNIYMHQSQIQHKNVDMSWIFTQAMFMNVNTILWTLSFEEIRNRYPRQEVESHLQVALECIKIASERWPGVISAVQLYRALIPACLRIYDNKGDVEMPLGSPADTTGYDSRSNTTSPSASNPNKPTPPPVQHQQQQQQHPLMQPSGAFSVPGESTVRASSFSFGQPLDLHISPGASPSNSALFSSSPSYSAYNQPNTSFMTAPSMSNQMSAVQLSPLFDLTPPAVDNPSLLLQNTQFQYPEQQPLPSTFNLDFWNKPDMDLSSSSAATVNSLSTTVPALSRFDSYASANNHNTLTPTDYMNDVGIPTNIPFGAVSPSNVPWTDYLYPPSAQTASLSISGVNVIGSSSSSSSSSNFGLTEEQQHELMASLNGKGMGAIQGMLDATNRVFYPAGRAPS